MAEPGAAIAKKMLPQRAHKHFSSAIAPRLISLNPTLELVAVATTENQVEVFRFGGQRAFGTRAHRDKPSIAAICWKFDGSELGLWWSDCTWQTIESSTGVVGPLLTFFGEDGSRLCNIDYVAWNATIIGPSTKLRVGSASDKSSDKSSDKPNGSPKSSSRRGSNMYTKGAGDGTDLPIEDMLSPEPIENSSDSIVHHLPTLLAAFTVLDELPRLSALPHVSNHELNERSEMLINIFSRQELMDSFVNFAESNVSDIMDVLFVGCSGPLLSITEGSNKLGICRLNVASGSRLQEVNTVLGCASHPSSYCQAMITSSSATGGPRDEPNARFGIFFTSLNFIPESGQYLSFVIRSVSQLVLLDRYIAFAIAAVREAWVGAREVFARYLQSIEETLSEKSARDKNRMDIVTALYRLAVTGHCEPAVEEWMKDIMGLKGVERWNSALPGGMVSVVDSIHGNLLPALDRASIEASRLRAMCRNGKVPICNLSERTLAQILDDLDIIRLLGNTALLYGRQEIPQVEVFATFMKCQIQIKKEPDSSAAKEAVETIAGLDYALLLSFITGPMTRSHLDVFLGREVSMIRNAPRRPKQQAPRKIILSMLDRHRQNPLKTTTPVVEFVNLLYQSWFLSDSVQTVQASFVKQFTDSSVATHLMPIDREEMSSATDIRMTFTKPSFRSKASSQLSAEEETPMATNVVAVPAAARDQIRIHRTVHKIALGTPSISTGPLGVSDVWKFAQGIITIYGCTIWDIKFASDESLILLLSGRENQTVLVQFPIFRFWEPSDYTPEALYDALPHHAVATGSGEQKSTPHSVQVNLANLEPYILHEFETKGKSSAFAPRSVQIRGPERTAKHILVLDETATKYQVFDLGGVDWQGT